MNNLPVDLFYEEFGSGQVFIFIHGFPLDHTTWLPIANIMKEKVRCILPDVRGLGRSPITGTEATIPEMAADVIRLMDRLNIQQAVISGHSMGGYIAMEMAHTYPDRVIGLGLIATRAAADTPEKLAARLESRREVLKNGRASIIKSMAPRLTEQSALLPKLVRVMEKSDPRGIAMCQYAMVNRADATAWLKAINYPIVVAAGGRDVIIPEDELRQLSQELKDGRFYYSPVADHMLPIIEPELIARALLETYVKD